MKQQSKRDPYRLVGGKLDRYQILEFVGLGGMGAVYRAQHEITKAIVAIKLLRPDLSVSEQEGVNYFFEEAAKTVALNHPCIIKVTSADYTSDGSAFMVMEWLDGQTLEVELKDRGVFSLARMMKILEQVCDAVSYAHGKNIIHRDLKPSNIMLVREEDDEETVRVLDFGIAKMLSATTGTNTRVAGTPYYISPEQTIAHGRIDHCSDIYSLGVVVYQMLTGQVPFEADTEGQLMDMHRSLSPKPLRQLRPEISQAVEEVVLRAMAKRPQDRYQTATDFARAFRQAANLASSMLFLQAVDARTGAPVSSAEVYINGKHAGQATEDGWWRQTDLIPRQYLIEVESARYTRWERSVELEAREELTVTVKLERESVGEMLIACNVPDAEVELDGQIAGRTDQTGRLYLHAIAAGKHSIRLDHSQYLPSESTVEVAVWQQAIARLELARRAERNPFKQAMRKMGSLFEKPKAQLRNERRGSQPKASSGRGIRPTDQKPARAALLAETVRVCGACGQQISANLRFCTECGAELSVLEPASPVADAHNPVSPPVSGRGTRPANKTKWIIAGIAALLTIAVAIGKLVINMAPQESLVIAALPNTKVVVDGRIEKMTDDKGQAMIEGLTRGPHTISISKPGFREIRQSITLPLAQPLALFTLNPDTPEGMVYVPGGTFQMGNGDANPDNPSGPPHEVTVKPFFMDKYEISAEAYRSVYHLPLSGDTTTETSKWPISMNWKAANDYCKMVGKRLPSEAEWEFAARGADGRLFPWGNIFDPSKANVANPNQKITPVGSLAGGSSPWGVFDLSGNLWEWTDTEYQNYPGSLHRPRACAEPCKVIRGGALNSPPKYATTVYRTPYEPTVLNQDAYNYIGARCAKDAPTK